MDRVAELEAQATRVQHRPGGLITDYFGCGPSAAERYGAPGSGVLVGDGDRMALVRCVHGKEWPEGDLAEGHGGKACAECVTASRA